MEKVYVAELGNDSKALFRKLAQAKGYSEEEIQNGLDSKIRDLDDVKSSIGFDQCQNPDCQRFFHEGYYMNLAALSYFCSSDCVEACIDDIEEEDYDDPEIIDFVIIGDDEEYY